jgi:hypothetical protein
MSSAVPWHNSISVNSLLREILMRFPAYSNEIAI